MSEAVKVLSSKGHELVHFQPPHLVDIYKDFFRFLQADLGRNNLARWSGDVLDQSTVRNSRAYKVPFWLKKTLFKFIFKFVSPSLEQIIDCALPFSGDLWTGIKEAEDRKAKVLKAWNDAGVDIVIGPGFAFPGKQFYYFLRKSLGPVKNNTGTKFSRQVNNI